MNDWTCRYWAPRTSDNRCGKPATHIVTMFDREGKPLDRPRYAVCLDHAASDKHPPQDKIEPMEHAWPRTGC